MKKTSPKQFNLILSIGIGLATQQTAYSANIYVETFPSALPKSGWLFGGLASSGGMIEQNDRYEFFSNNYERHSLFAIPSTSNGAFVGDYINTNIKKIEFDFQLDAGSAVSELHFDLTGSTSSLTRWQFILTTPSIGTIQRYSIPLTPDGTGWVRTSGSESFATTLSDVSEIAISLENTTVHPGNIAGYLDNVSTVPEPSLPILLMSGLFTCFVSRRRNQSHQR